MKRLLLILVLVALVMGVMAAPVAAPNGSAEVKRSQGCDVSWSVLPEGEFLTDSDCEVHNVMTPAGDYYVVLHGQIPDDAMEDFMADGSPKRFDTGCLVNFLFWLDSGGEDTMLFTESVRKFTKNGQMTEVCKPPVISTLP